MNRWGKPREKNKQCIKQQNMLEMFDGFRRQQLFFVFLEFVVFSLAEILKPQENTTQAFVSQFFEAGYRVCIFIRTCMCVGAYHNSLTSQCRCCASVHTITHSLVNVVVGNPMLELAKQYLYLLSHPTIEYLKEQQDRFITFYCLQLTIGYIR